MLRRKIEKDIVNWLKNENKALLIDGARQVGKTTLCNLFSLWYATQFDNKKIKYYTVAFRHISYSINSIKLAFSISSISSLLMVGSF